MGSFALELLLCVLAFGFGYAANQGGTCLVVAAHELHRRQPPKMFVGFLAASAAAGLVAVPIVWTGTLGATLAPSTSINFLLLIGAIAFGLGALINDTCLLGSLARLGDGEMRLLALPLGLTIGILAADHGRFGYDSTWPSLISKPSATGLVTLLAFLVVLVLALVFVSTKSVLRTKPGWSFGASMIGLGILRLQLPTANGILRSVVGGTLMGIGIALIPGGNDGLILAAVPTLSPGGIVAYLLMTTTIVFGFAARGKLFRRCLSRP
ncbi:YeeE/YedE thiosulfate transporter family protein [Klebsiella grimontii]|uniref:YeeE/YedE thiosulfate transporter family protein n=1 Tax=Klebsiella grimontii TaxID=2058152 RepID=UPI002930B85C|nr:YeeE/YedE thiosulfate transporter family protein [Klebsiella grimontii]